jgi:hypothetical protein
MVIAEMSATALPRCDSCLRRRWVTNLVGMSHSDQVSHEIVFGRETRRSQVFVRCLAAAARLRESLGCCPETRTRKRDFGSHAFTSAALIRAVTQLGSSAHECAPANDQRLGHPAQEVESSLDKLIEPDRDLHRLPAQVRLRPPA